MKKLLLITFLSVVYADINAQFECFLDESPETYVSTPKSGSECSNFLNYIPDYQNMSNHEDLTVKINVHFFRDGSGNGVFQPPLDQKVEDLINYVNAHYNNLSLPVLPVNPPADEIPSTKIKFETQNIYWHDDDYGYSSDVICGSYYFDNFKVNPNCEINIFFFLNPNKEGGCAPSYINMFSKTGAWLTNPDSFWGYSQILAHELGHVLGLGHTFGGGCTDDIFDDTYYPDHNKAWASCGSNESHSYCNGGIGISNNIMGYNMCRNYFSPKQIGTMRYNLITGNLRNFLKDNYDATNSITVNSNQTWSDSKFVTGNITVKSGNTLTVKCNVYLADSSKVFVEQGAKLIIDGGKLTNSNTNGCNPNQKYWYGVQVYGTTNQNQYPAHNPTHQGLLVLQNGGTIEFAHDGARNWKNNSWGEIGGVIQSSNNIFRNNRRDVVPLPKLLT